MGINDHPLELPIEKHHIVMLYTDRPGIVAVYGQKFGEAGKLWRGLDALYAELWDRASSTEARIKLARARHALANDYLNDASTALDHLLLLYRLEPSREVEDQLLAAAEAQKAWDRVLPLVEANARSQTPSVEALLKLARLHEEINLTSVFVTHDQEEAMEVADRIVVMNKGVIEQIGSPAEVYEHPANPFVYHFLGDANRLYMGEEHHILFRPHEISLSRSAADEHRPAEVRDIRPLGAITRVTLKVDGQDELIEAEVVKDHDSLVGLARGETLYFKPKAYQQVANI